MQKGATKLHDQQVEVDSLKGYSKREISELKEQMHKSYEDQLKRITEMVFFMLLVLISNCDIHMYSFLRSGNHILKLCNYKMPIMVAVACNVILNCEIWRG